MLTWHRHLATGRRTSYGLRGRDDLASQYEKAPVLPDWGKRKRTDFAISRGASNPRVAWTRSDMKPLG